MFQREDNLAVNYLKKWSAYRSRLKTQMARKNESMKGFSGTSKAKLQKNS